MYCIKCGVKLAQSEKKCPLCNTIVYHPDFEVTDRRTLYPENKMPEINSSSKALNGALIILFMLPIVVCFFADLLIDGVLEWSDYVFGALLVAYVMFALPLWFKKANPVIFVPCSFVTVGLYLLYINLASGGKWFLSFALPITGGLCLITCAVVTLLYYLKRGRLYILGGAFIALGMFMPVIELLLMITFNVALIAWSVYPLSVLIIIGGLLIYFAINKTARETMERKLFF